MAVRKPIVLIEGNFIAELPAGDTVTGQTVLDYLADPTTNANADLYSTIVALLADMQAKGMMAGPILDVPTMVVAPAVTGTLIVGSVLTCSTGTWTGSPTSYAYQWQEDIATVWTDVTGETTNTYTTDHEGTFRCQVIATNAIGDSDPVYSNEVVVVESGGGGTYIAPIFRAAYSNGALGSSSARVSVDMSGVATNNAALVFVSCGTGEDGVVIDDTGNSNVYTELTDLGQEWAGQQAMRVFICQDFDGGSASVDFTFNGPANSYPSIGIMFLDKNGAPELLVGGHALAVDTSNPRTTATISPDFDTSLAVSMLATAITSTTMTHTANNGFTKQTEVTNGSVNWCFAVGTKSNSGDDDFASWDANTSDEQGVNLFFLAGEIEETLATFADANAYVLLSDGNTRATYTGTPGNVGNCISNAAILEPTYFEVRLYHAGADGFVGAQLWGEADTTLIDYAVLGQWYGKAGIYTGIQDQYSVSYLAFYGLPEEENGNIALWDGPVPTTVDVYIAVSGRNVWLSSSADPVWYGGGDPALGTTPTLVVPGSEPIKFGAAVDDAANNALLLNPSEYTGTAPVGFRLGVVA